MLFHIIIMFIARRSAAALLVATVALARPTTSTAQKQVVVPAGRNASAALSPGIRAGDLLFVSGQLGISGDPADSTIQAQTKRSLDNMKAVLEAAGTSATNVVKCTVFLVDVKDFAGMNQAYTQFFTKEPPARSTVAVAALMRTDAKVEIECIATIPK